MACCGGRPKRTKPPPPVSEPAESAALKAARERLAASERVLAEAAERRKEAEALRESAALQHPEVATAPDASTAEVPLGAAKEQQETSPPSDLAAIAAAAPPSSGGEEKGETLGTVAKAVVAEAEAVAAAENALVDSAGPALGGAPESGLQERLAIASASSLASEPAGTRAVEMTGGAAAAADQPAAPDVDADEGKDEGAANPASEPAAAARPESSTLTNGNDNDWAGMAARRRRRKQQEEEEEEEQYIGAAVRIQSRARGQSTRRNYHYFRVDRAVVFVQAFLRGWLTRKAINEEHDRENAVLAQRRQRQHFLRDGGGLELNVEFFMTPRMKPAPEPSRARVNRIKIPSAAGGGMVLDDIEVTHMKNGMEVRLYDDRSTTTPISFLWLAPDLRYFYWRSAGADDRIAKLPMEAIKSIVFGPCTDTFRRRGSVLAQLASDPWQCFSFITDEGSFDFAATQDRDARTVIVGVQLIKCAGQRKYVRKGVLLWQTARMRLKRNALLTDSTVYSALIGLLRKANADKNDEERKDRRLQWLQDTAGEQMATDFFLSSAAGERDSKAGPYATSGATDAMAERRTARTSSPGRSRPPQHVDSRSSRAAGGGGGRLSVPSTPERQGNDGVGGAPNTIRTPLSPYVATRTITGPEMDRLTAGIEVLLYEGFGPNGMIQPTAAIPQCTLTLSPDLKQFGWVERTGRRRNGVVPMDSIRSIVFGPCTDTFRRRGSLLASEPWQCFSFITSKGSADFAATVDRDARTVIVGVQLIKCAGQRKYVRNGVLLWQTARMRLKRAAIQQRCGICAVLLQVLKRSMDTSQAEEDDGDE